MNRALQPETHPDAESLSAFTEQALPSPERALIFEHIASCTRCREIVFLSQLSAPDAPQSAVHVNRENSRPWEWSLAWRFVLAPAGALALIVLVTILVRAPGRQGQQQMARVTPPSQPVPPAARKSQQSTTAATPSPSSNYGHPLAKKAEPDAGARELSAEDRMASKCAGAGAAEVAAGNAFETEPAAAPLPPGSSEQTAPPQVAAQLQQDSAIEAWREQPRTADGISAAPSHARAAKMRANVTAEHAPTATASFKTKALDAGGFASPPQPIVYADPALKFEQSNLPSGQPSVSRATIGGKSVAIDNSGTVFLSANASAVWTPVVKQWTGRAVQVRARPSSTGGNVGDAAVSAAPIFELVNDSNLVWSSQDGSIWKPE
jgi:hypothetical protein